MRFSLVYFTVILLRNHIVNATRKETSNIFNHEKTVIYKGFTKSEELEKQVVQYCSNQQGYDPDPYGRIEDWDVSRITYMGHLFDFELIGNITISCPDCKDCNPNISKWNVSAVESFRFMFKETAKFDHDIGDWDVSNASDFNGMFLRACAFNQDIGRWDVSSSENFSEMFEMSPVFNSDISAWDVSKGLYFRHMFDSTAIFDQDIGNWDVSRGNNFENMFKYAAEFNQDISSWDLSDGYYFSSMFENAKKFRQNLNSWLKWINDAHSLKWCDGAVCDAFDCQKLSKQKCKKEKKLCRYSRKKNALGDCKAKDGYEYDCTEHITSSTCVSMLNHGYCNWNDDICSHKCDDLAKKNCKKVKFLSTKDKMCTIPKIRNPCYKCNPRSTC